MKIEREDPEFRPVTITLETQEEADLLHALLDGTPGGYVNNMTYRLYRELDKASKSVYSEYWRGRFFVKED